jgi:hypothetical protein
MTLNEIAPLLASLGFDCNQTPARFGRITLAELEYDEIDSRWHFRFRYDDIRLKMPMHELPKKAQDIIDRYASPGETDTMIYGHSYPINCAEGCTVMDICNVLHQEISSFQLKMIKIENMVKEWM